MCSVTASGGLLRMLSPGRSMARRPVGIIFTPCITSILDWLAETLGGHSFLPSCRTCATSSAVAGSFQSTLTGMEIAEAKKQS